jgi:hypothetical protein
MALSMANQAEGQKRQKGDKPVYGQPRKAVHSRRNHFSPGPDSSSPHPQKNQQIDRKENHDDDFQP